MWNIIFSLIADNWIVVALIVALIYAFIHFGVAGVATVLAVAAGWFGFKFGRDGERIKQADKERKDAKTIQDIRTDVQGATPAAKKKRLDKWTRNE